MKKAYVMQGKDSGIEFIRLFSTKKGLMEHIEENYCTMTVDELRELIKPVGFVEYYSVWDYIKIKLAYFY